MKTTAFLFIAFFSGLLFCSNAVQAQIILNPELGKKYLLTADIDVVYNKAATPHRGESLDEGDVVFGLFLTPEKINAVGNYTVKCQLQHLTYSLKKSGEEIAASEEASKNRNKKFENSVKIFRENTFMLELSKKGELISINGLDEIAAKIMKSRGESDEEIGHGKDERLWLINNALTALFNQFTSFYTDAAVKPGDVYTKAGDMNLLMVRAERSSDYTIKEVNKSAINLTGKGSITIGSDSAKTVFGKVNSDITLDATTGLIQKGVYNYDIFDPEEEKREEKMNFTITISIKEAE